MPLIKQEEIAGGLLLLWEITEDLELMNVLAEEFTNDPTYLKITHPKRKKEWLAVRLLQKVAGCNKEQFHYNDVGQPCIDHPVYKSISISHSSNLVGIYLHTKPTTGLDIESEDRNFVRVEKKYLSDEESQMAKETQNGYGWFWCIKEAAYKAAGIPGLAFRDQINIDLQKNGSPEVKIKGESHLCFNIYQKKLSGQLIVCLTLQSTLQV